MKASQSPIVAGLLAFLTIIVLTFILQYTEKQRYHQALQARTVSQLSQIRANLETGINTDFHLTRGLLALIATHPDLDQDTFHRIADNLLRNHNSIRNIGLAPDNILSFVHPIAGNEKAIGLNYTKNKQQWPAVQRAIEQRKTVVAGPVDLVQGGRGFITRTPIYIDNPDGQPGVYWGLASIVVDETQLFRTAGFYDDKLDISVAIRGVDGLGRDGQIFAGDKTIIQNEPVLLDVMLPEGTWQLAATPRGGWNKTSPYALWLYTGGVTLALLVGFGVYFWVNKLMQTQFAIEAERQKSEEAAKTLKRNEQFLSTIFENIPNMIFIKDAEELRFVSFNRAGEELMGYSREDLFGKNDYDFFPIEQADFFVSKDRAVLKNKALLEIQEEELDTKYKGRRVLHTKKIPLLDENGHPQYLLGISEDITERNQAEAERRKLESQLAQAMELAHLGYWEYDIEGDYFTFNDQFYKILRTTEAEAGGYRMSSSEYVARFVPLEERAAVGEELRKLLVTSDHQYSRQLAHPIVYGDGTQGYITIQFVAIEDAQGKIATTYGVSQDISTHKNIEDALEKRMIALTRPLDDPEGIALEDLFNLNDIQRLQDQFAEATGVASIITNTAGAPITKPSNFCRLCSEIIRKTKKGLAQCYTSDAAIGRQNPQGPIMQPCLSGGLWDAGAGISVGGKHIANWLIGQVRDETQTDERIRRYAHEIGADEDSVVKAYYEVTAMSREQFGAIARMLFTLANQLSAVAYQNVQQARFITEIKRTDKEKEELESKLRQSQKMEAVGRLAGGVAHDFNNMLGVIIGHASMAQEEVAKDSRLYGVFEEILNAGKRSSDLTRQLLAFARKQTVSPNVLDLNETLKGMTTMLRRLIGEDVELAWFPGKNLWPVYMDPSQIDQILANLCINARDAIMGVGTVTIETDNVDIGDNDCSNHLGFNPGEYVLLAVSDNGCGMDATTLENIFEPFYTTKEIGRGTGLGLSTVYGVVKQNGGFINVYSEVGQGTTFKIYFPKYEKTKPSAIKQKEKLPVKTGNETILLVEDETAILQMATKMLEQLGYTVAAASTPGEAMQVAHGYSGEIHLLVTDVVMPEMNGREMARKMLSIHPKLRILFMSGYPANVVAHNGVLDEGVNFIQKPFTREQLGTKVREAIDRR